MADTSRTINLTKPLLRATVLSLWSAVIQSLLYDMIRDAIVAALQPVQRIPDVFEDEDTGLDDTYIYPDEQSDSSYIEQNTYQTFDGPSDYIGEQASFDFTSSTNSQGAPNAHINFDQDDAATEEHIHPVPTYLQDLVKMSLKNCLIWIQKLK